MRPARSSRPSNARAGRGSTPSPSHGQIARTTLPKGQGSVRRQPRPAHGRRTAATVGPAALLQPPRHKCGPERNDDGALHVLTPWSPARKPRTIGSSLPVCFLQQEDVAGWRRRRSSAPRCRPPMSRTRRLEHLDSITADNIIFDGGSTASTSSPESTRLRAASIYCNHRLRRAQESRHQTTLGGAQADGAGGGGGPGCASWSARLSGEAAGGSVRRHT